MGRKRGGRPGAQPLPPPPLLLLVLLLFCALLRGGCSLKNVGCLFSENICEPELEKCFNDLVFGRCVRGDGYSSEDDFYQYNLEPEELDKLRVQLERLEYEGYKWPDHYTQCVLGILLEDLRYSLTNSVEEMCKHLRYQNEGYADDEKKLDDGEDLVGSRESTRPVALVKFTPSKINPHGDFADEFYYPPEMREEMNEERGKSNDFNDYDEGFYDKLSTFDNPHEAYHRGSRSLSKASLASALPASSYPKAGYAIPREYVEALQSFLENEDRLYRKQDSEMLDYLSSDNKKPMVIEDEPMDDDYKTFARRYKYPMKELESLDFLGQQRDVVPEIDGDDYAVVGGRGNGKFQKPRPISKTVIDSLVQPSGMYGESGTIVPLSRDVMTPDEDLQAYLIEMLRRQEMAGFKRRERLDVKKPGPLFSTNNYAFRTESSPSPLNESSDDNARDSKEIYLPQQVKKEVHNSKFTNSENSYENVDLDHVYIQFDQEFHSWSEGDSVVNLVSSLIGLQPGELKDIRVGRAEVTFKVPPNSKNYNATDIINKIDNIRSELQKQLKIQVIRAGIGDKAKLPAILEVPNNGEMSLSIFGTIVAVGVAAVSAAAIVILIIARQHAKSRAKLAGLRTPDPEASKDYQELCRARMQAKQSDKLSESPKGFDFGRLIESGKSESNRSSTSSWSEEPPVTNMDIATGHVVLAYIEEHLKNQDKLDEEWAALCAYEAEPCSTAIAEAEGNAECNRAGAALPYDHSRVILNDLVNINNSDYINASTITDHDPRNPAYIATQGPLPQTVADFWQLVWEQGSVVIVTLTRLTEAAQTMCERYWPDEGSELYHIYEVHLVSEHIWCDDYLVRSFYLKNLRTGETRTVTQFHFQTWPENGVPRSTKALLEFRRKVNKSYRGRSCPIIVHCSDGAGRTGTYCLIDMILNRMAKGAKEIDIAATLEHIRDQRSGMVVTRQQFEFVLMAIAEEVNVILKSLPPVGDNKPPANNGEKPSTSAAAAAKSDI